MSRQLCDAAMLLCLLTTSRNGYVSCDLYTCVCGGGIIRVRLRALHRDVLSGGVMLKPCQPCTLNGAGYRSLLRWRAAPTCCFIGLQTRGDL